MRLWPGLAWPAADWRLSRRAATSCWPGVSPRLKQQTPRRRGATARTPTACKSPAMHFRLSRAPTPASVAAGTEQRFVPHQARASSMPGSRRCRAHRYEMARCKELVRPPQPLTEPASRLGHRCLMRRTPLASCRQSPATQTAATVPTLPRRNSHCPRCEHWLGNGCGAGRAESCGLRASHG